MSNDNHDEVLLPTRDFLRQLIGQPKIKNTDLKNILRNRGVFTGSDDKEIIGPVIIKTGLSPSEYIELREGYRSKEENPKSKTRTIAWNSESPLIDAMPDSINYEQLLNDNFGVLSIKRITDFTTSQENPNHIYIDFELYRNDTIKNLGESVSIHSGRIEIKRDESEPLLNISIIHTAPETRDFSNKVTGHLIDHFKFNGYINKDEYVKVIKFADFNNTGRILFFNELTQKVLHSNLNFSDTKDIHFSPDNTIHNHPDNIAWMKDKIEDMKIRGSDLHSTFFVKDAALHPFIQLFGMQCDYTFQAGDSSGTCRILFEFAENDDSQGSELILNLSMLKLESNDSGTPRSTLKRKILESLEKCKLQTYEKYKLNQ